MVQSNLMKVEKASLFHRTKAIHVNLVTFYCSFCPEGQPLSQVRRGKAHAHQDATSHCLRKQSNSGSVGNCQRRPVSHTWHLQSSSRLEKLFRQSAVLTAFPVFREPPGPPERQLLKTLVTPHVDTEALKFTLCEVLNFVHVVIYCTSEKLNPAFF